MRRVLIKKDINSSEINASLCFFVGVEIRQVNGVEERKEEKNGNEKDERKKERKMVFSSSRPPDETERVL